MIPDTYLVNITDNVNLNDPADPLCPSVRISVSGRIDFDKGKKIRLDAGACMTVEWGGSIHPSELGGGKSEGINIGNDTWWKAADGILNGLAAMGCVSPMPIDDIDLKLAVNEENISLSWTASQEDNIDYFLLERSDDGFGWEVIAKVEAVHMADRPYQVSDEKSVLTRYYRLKAISNEGMVNLVETEVYLPSVNFRTNEMQVLPNPVSTEAVIALSFDFDAYGETTVQVCNHLGQVIYSEVHNLDRNQHSLTIGRNALGTGNYFVVLSNQKNRLTGKLVIL